jgi:hypothetical protein
MKASSRNRNPLSLLLQLFRSLRHFTLTLFTRIPICAGAFRYLTLIFYIFAFLYFALGYFAEVVPAMDGFCSSPDAHLILSLALLPIPWIFFVLFQCVDPGTINANNVDSYLKAYPYDSVLYFPKTCPTDHIPVVARSRYCRFTRRRIA